MRHLKATLIIGLASILLVIGLCALDGLEPFNRAFWELIANGIPSPAESATAVDFSLLLMAFGGAWVTIDIDGYLLKFVVVAAAFLQMFSLAWVMALYQLYLPPFAPDMALVLSFGLGLLYSLSKPGSRKRNLQVLFGGRLSRKSLYSLANSDVPLAFNGEVREVTVLVCEIFNHRELMDAMSTEEYVGINNTFLQTCSRLVLERGAFTEKCDPERVRVIFGAPVPDSQSAETACETALELARQLDEASRECVFRWKVPLDFRIAINSGEVTAAAYGAPGSVAYGISGESVDFSPRLCAANLIYGSRILIGTETLTRARDAIEVRPVELIRTQEPRTREEIYELLGMKDSLPVDELRRRDLFWKGVIYYREQLLDQALESFRAAMDAGRESDPTLEFYIRRIEQRRAEIPEFNLEGIKF